MRISIVRVIAALLPLALCAAEGKVALPGYQYQFPRDHFSHPEYATEWWYYTGNLQTPEGKRFGYELTFFRQAISLRKGDDKTSAVWNPDQVYLAHLALSDIDGKHFFHFERLNRAGPGLAGIEEGKRYWNGNWQVSWTSTVGHEQRLQAVCDKFKLTLQLQPQKPVVIHGKEGVSQKAEGVGKASHYLSFTRIKATGELRYDGKQQAVEGLSWMDHEFFTHQLDVSQSGWDWFSIQLNNGEELMMYLLRRKDGSIEPASSGTWIDRQGQAHYLPLTNIQWQHSDNWVSPNTKASYPLQWMLRVPSLQLELKLTTPLRQQELASQSHVAPSYWEGSIRLTGQMHGKAVEGSGYLEMTGYDRQAQFGER